MLIGHANDLRLIFEHGWSVLDCPLVADALKVWPQQGSIAEISSSISVLKSVEGTKGCASLQILAAVLAMVERTALLVRRYDLMT